MEVMVEGTMKGKFVRAYWKDGEVDMHELVRMACDAEIATGLSSPPFAGQPHITSDFYSTPEGFVALMKGTLTEVSKVEGLEPVEREGLHDQLSID